MQYLQDVKKEVLCFRGCEIAVLGIQRVSKNTNFCIIDLPSLGLDCENISYQFGSFPTLHVELSVPLFLSVQL